MAKFDHFNLIGPIYDRIFGRNPDSRIYGLANVEPHHRLLDVGGGTGRVAEHFSATTPHIFVVDAALKMLIQARLKGMRVVNACSEALPLPDRRFDRIIMVDAFHHVADHQKTLDEMWRLLAPGGRLIVEDPDIRHGVIKLIALVEKLLLMRSKFFTPQNILGMCSYRDIKSSQIITEKGIAWVIIDKTADPRYEEIAMTEINVRQVMQSIPDHFNAEKAQGVSGVVQIMLSGEQASDWVLTIENQTCVVEEGKTHNPDLTIKSDAEVGVDLLTGKLDAMRAYMLGKVKVFGDLALGMKLVSFFDK